MYCTYVSGIIILVHDVIFFTHVLLIVKLTVWTTIVKWLKCL